MYPIGRIGDMLYGKGSRGIRTGMSEQLPDGHRGAKKRASSCRWQVGVCPGQTKYRPADDTRAEIPPGHEFFMTKKISAFDIVLVPPEDICQKAMNVSQQFEKKGGLFTLDGVNYFPHITVYAAEFSEKNIPKIEKVLEKFASQTRPFAMTSLCYRQEGRGYVVVDYRKSKKIKELRERIIDLVHSFCEECKKKNRKQISVQCGLAHEFVPHLTFTKFEHYTPSALSRIKELDFSFRAGTIGLYYLGEYGTCRKLVQVFDFSVIRKIAKDRL